MRELAMITAVVLTLLSTLWLFGFVHAQ